MNAYIIYQKIENIKKIYTFFNSINFLIYLLNAHLIISIKIIPHNLTLNLIISITYI